MIFLEEMAEDPVATLEGVFDFLGMDFVDPDGIKVRDFSRIRRRGVLALIHDDPNGVVKRKFLGRMSPDAV